MKAIAIFVVASTAVLAAGQNAFLTKPDIYGDMVVFTAEGDLWLGSIEGKTAKRLTADAGVETYARFSPDGKSIAFSGQYDGGNDVYVMPVEGGAPRRVTFDPKNAQVMGWTLDGAQIIFRSTREVPTGAGERRLFAVSAKGGLPQRLPVPRGDFASMSRSGKLAYVPVSNEWANWFQYQGGRADDVWLYDTGRNSFKRLTDHPAIDTTPAWCGEDLFFVSERAGVSNLFKLDPATRRVTQATQYGDAQVRYPASDGKRIIFQHGAGLAIYDPASGRSQLLAFDLNSDRIHTRERFVRLSADVQNPALGPTGKRLAIESRGQIVTVAAEQGDLRVVERKNGTRARMPAWSPDGKSVAFISDRSGENEIWLTDSAGGKEPTQLTRGLKANPYPPIWSPDGSHLALGDREGRILLIDAKTGVIRVAGQADRMASYDSARPSLAFSPDGKFLAHSQLQPNWVGSVHLVEVATGRVAQISHFAVNAYAPSFDVTGKYLIYCADTELNAAYSSPTNRFYFDATTKVVMVALADDTDSPFLPKIDEEVPAEKKPDAGKDSRVTWEGLEHRTIEVPIAPGRYFRVESIPGKLLLLSSTIPYLFAGGGPGSLELISFDLDKRTTTRIVPSLDGFALSADRKKMLLTLGGALSVVDTTTGPTTVAAAPVNLAPYSLTVDPVSEWQQVFNESWRLARDFFYDPGMHGVDWDAVRRRYQPRMSRVASRNDLTIVLKDMVSELRSGHAYIIDPTPAARTFPIALLGADFAGEAGVSGVKITKIYRGDDYTIGQRSPLLEPGVKVKEGDYLLAVAGQRLAENQDPNSLLLGMRGQTVALTVNDKPTMEGARVVRVRPLSTEDGLRYAQWVRDREAYVRRNGGENFGYVHVPNMGAGGLTAFTKGHFPNIYKDAVVYDTRYNTGGNISTLLLENLNLTPIAWWKPRFGEYWTRESWAAIGHKAAVANEYNFSDGELFLEVWRRLKLGPIVGKRTGGGEVGSGGGYGLIDGGAIYVPNYGAFVGDEWIVEGTGTAPDYDVEQDPAAVMAGRDPQLDKAIELLKAKLVKEPIKRPKHPPFPKKGG